MPYPHWGREAAGRFPGCHRNPYKRDGITRARIAIVKPFKNALYRRLVLRHREDFVERSSGDDALGPASEIAVGGGLDLLGDATGKHTESQAQLAQK